VRVPDVTVEATSSGNRSVLGFVEHCDDRDAEGAEVREGDVIEFTLRGERRTAEAMLVTDDGVVLLDLFDGDRPAWATLSDLEDVSVFRPDHVVTAV
jgi:hypothetical protein